MTEVETYPGSSQPLRSAQRRVELLAGTEAWKDPKYVRRLDYHGQPRDFYGIAALAVALKRAPGTLRGWERNGYLPPAKLRSDSDDPEHGERRLYTTEQIEGLIELAVEEGLYEGAQIGSTDFPRKSKELFARLAAG